MYRMALSGLGAFACAWRPGRLAKKQRNNILEAIQVTTRPQFASRGQELTERQRLVPYPEFPFSSTYQPSSASEGKHEPSSNTSLSACHIGLSYLVNLVAEHWLHPKAGLN